MMGIQENISLRDHTTIRVGGPARFFVIVKNGEELTRALSWARDHGVPYFTVGGGSNLVIDDRGYPGLVVKLQFSSFLIDSGRVRVGASVTLEDLIERTLAARLVGLEFAAGIPGTVGGAVRGNAGTYGVAMSDVVEKVAYVDEHVFRERRVSGGECQFAYRHSMFKQHNHIITEALLGLRTGDVEASRKLIGERIAIRHERHPHEPSAGCIFKNVEFSKADPGVLRARGLEVAQFAQYQKIPAGYLIERLGLKGTAIGGAKVSEKHANYIINTGTATFEEVVTLISLIKQRVRDTYGIQLEEEAQVVPYDLA